MDKYEKKGWETVKKTEQYIEYRRPKRFSWAFFILFNLFYVIYYATRPAWQHKVVKRK